jgi:hypothetical protein
MHKQSTGIGDISKDDRLAKINVQLYQLNDLRARALQLTESAPLLLAINKRREELLAEKAELLREALISSLGGRRGAWQRWSRR